MIENGIEWPDEVPVLTADDVCQGDGGMDGEGRRCLVWWVCLVFSGTKAFRPALRAVKSAAGIPNHGSLIGWNDKPRRRKTTLARTWNKAMASLGYTEGNPDA